MQDIASSNEVPEADAVEQSLPVANDHDLDADTDPHAGAFRDRDVHEARPGERIDADPADLVEQLVTVDTPEDDEDRPDADADDDTYSI